MQVSGSKREESSLPFRPAGNPSVETLEAFFNRSMWLVSAGMLLVVLTTWLAFYVGLGLCLGLIVLIAFLVSTAKRMLAQMRVSDHHLRAAFEVAQEGMFILDTEGRILEANPAAAQFLLHAPADLRGHTFAEFIGQAGTAGLEQSWQDYITQGIVQGEFTTHAPDGTIRAIEYSATSDVMPGLHLAVIRDISSHKQAELALRASEAQYRTLVETSPDAILLLDLQGVVLICNSPAIAMRGALRRSDVVGQHLLTFIAPDDRDRVRAQVAQVLAQHRSTSGEYAFQREDGSRFLAELSLASILNDAGQPRALVALARNITERKRAEAALLRVLAEDRVAKMEVANQQRVETVSSISHALRTPFTALRAGLGMVEFSVRDRLRPEEIQLLGTVRRNVARVGILITDLLTFNQWELGVLKLDQGPIDLRAIIEEASEVVMPQLQEKDQALDLDLPESLPYQGDEKRLSQVIVDLIDNAHRHTPAGTQITVSGRRSPAGVWLQIRDTGPGIPAEDHERIFERFQRLDVTAGGMGLGLAIARRIVELHGGRIWVESTPGHGTVFHITLPLLADDSDPA